MKPILLFLLFAISPELNYAAIYYIDSREGNDVNQGNTALQAWKSLEKVNSFEFKPGDSACFRRGSVWVGQLTINGSGTDIQSITYTAYGDGDNPVIRNPGVNMGSAIRINGSWIIVENFMTRDAHEAGIYIAGGADHNIVRYNEATTVGIGIAVHGKYNLVSHNYAHDLTIIRNTRGGDDDYGAVGIWMFSSNNEVAYNRMINCKAPSYDYGEDGGVVEFYGDVDSCYIHHNWGENCVGAFEVGGKGQTLSHNLISYNVYINNQVAGGFHVGGNFGVRIEDMRIENNTFIETGAHDYAIGLWGDAAGPVDILYRNNILYIPNYKRVSNQTGFIHQNNLYFIGGRTDPDFISGPVNEEGDPLFINVNGKNFHLKPGSPAIDSGKEMGHREDFDRNPVPKGSSPDIGAFEFNH